MLSLRAGRGADGDHYEKGPRSMQKSCCQLCCVAQQEPNLALEVKKYVPCVRILLLVLVFHEPLIDIFPAIVSEPSPAEYFSCSRSMAKTTIKLITLSS